MGARRSSLNTGLRIAVALAAGIVVGGAAPATAPSAVGQPPTCRSRSDCGPRVMGGLQITFTGWSCTTGFVARDTETGKVIVLTAGHCVAGSGLLALWSHHGVAIGRASVDAFHPGSNADVGAIDLADARASNEVYGSSRTDIRSVTAWASNASQTVGSKVCRSGATSGWRLRIDRRRRRRRDHRWSPHSPHVVDRLSIGRRGQRLPSARQGWARGRHRDRDDADAIGVLDCRVDRYRAARTSLRYSGLRLIRHLGATRSKPARPAGLPCYHRLDGDHGRPDPDDRARQRRAPMRRLPRDHRGHALAGEPPRHRRRRGAGRLDGSTRDQPGPVPVPSRPRLRASLDGRPRLPVLPSWRGPRDHAADRDPDRSTALGPVRRDPSRRSRVRPRLTASDRVGTTARRAG